MSLTAKDCEGLFVTYRHFRTLFNGSMTVCCEVYPKAEKMSVGFAFYSPNEMKKSRNGKKGRFFCKELGRQISLGRLTVRPILIDIEGTFLQSVWKYLRHWYYEGKFGVDESPFPKKAPDWFSNFLREMDARLKG